MKPNESPSIFPKQGRDLWVQRGRRVIAWAFEDEPQDEQKPNVTVMLNTSLCKTYNTHVQLSNTGEACEDLFHYDIL